MWPTAGLTQPQQSPSASTEPVMGGCDSPCHLYLLGGPHLLQPPSWVSTSSCPQNCPPNPQREGLSWLPAPTPAWYSLVLLQLQQELLAFRLQGHQPCVKLQDLGKECRAERAGNLASCLPGSKWDREPASKGVLGESVGGQGAAGSLPTCPGGPG